jgi:hypothetical protein
MEVRVDAKRHSETAWKEAIYLKDVFGPRMGIPIEKVGVRPVVIRDPDRGNKIRRMYGVFVTIPDEYAEARMTDEAAIVASWQIR